MTASDPHGDVSPSLAGPAADDASAALVLVHGRGGSAAGMLELTTHLGAEDFHVVGLQALGNSWYPQSFLAPIESNEPGRSSGLRRLEQTINGLEEAGIGRASVVLLGFSQGACLSLEYVSLHPARYGAVVGFSGGLIGPLGLGFERGGSLQGTPVLLGCSDRDPHIPLKRVHETTMVLSAMDAVVDERIYPGMGHTVNGDELDAARALIERVRTETTRRPR